MCIPSKSTEAWVVAALFPADSAMRSGIECHPDPETRLGQQPKAHRIKKRQGDYEARAAELEREWRRLALPGGLSEASRFRSEFVAALPIP